MRIKIFRFSLEWCQVFVRFCSFSRFYLSWPSYSYKMIKMLSVCVWMSTRVTQIVAVAHSDFYCCTLIAYQKLGQSDLLYGLKSLAEEVLCVLNKHFQTS